MQFNFKIFIITAFIFSAFFGVQNVHAGDPKLTIRDDNYSARFASQSIPDPIVIHAGETETVVFKFKNVGSKTWDGSGRNYISAYTVEPKYRKSEFQADNWLGAGQTAKIEGLVKPGELGILKLQLKAPEKTGEYVERFYLASENNTWVGGSYFFVKIKVISNIVAKNTENKIIEKVEDQNINTRPAYSANLKSINRKKAEVKGGQKIIVTAVFENKGNKTWGKYYLTSQNDFISTASVNNSKLSFVDKSWVDNNVIATGEKEILPDGTLRKTFHFRAPVKKGEYTASFNLQIAGDSDSDPIAMINIPVSVTEDAPHHYVVPDLGKKINIKIKKDTPRLSSEPKIRVGLWKPEEKVEFVSEEDDYLIYLGQDSIGVLKKGVQATLSYKNKIYYLKSGDNSFDFESDKYIKLKPKNNQHAVFTLLNYDRHVSWKGPMNFNTYRGSAEYRLTQDEKNIYLINELYFEDYIAGIGETSNAAPIEYIKALLSAARTYAYYIKEYSGRHTIRNFDVVAHTGDQLYLGYASEKLMPRVAEATRATRGYMVTYDSDNNKNTESDIIITPYFAHSDGKTRTWVQAGWGKTNKPWLQSVKAEYDVGKRMYGHGVGMSARDAAYRADEEGVDWKYLLEYYYTGVGVERVY
jgi:hypothetical protein